MSINFYDFYRGEERNVEDRCNICSKQRKLTDDHVPPQVCGNHGTVAASASIFNYYIGANIREGGRNGIKFRTICEECNNTKLGSECDPALGQFTAQWWDIIRTRLHLPRSYSVDFYPYKVIRAIIGHSLAMKLHYEENVLDLALRRFWNAPDVECITDFSIFFWPHSYDRIAIAPEIMKTVIPHDYRTNVLMTVLKFPPILFIIAQCDDLPNGLRISDWWTNDPDCIKHIPLSMVYTIPSEGWPEDIDDGTVLLGGANLFRLLTGSLH